MTFLLWRQPALVRQRMRGGVGGGRDLFATSGSHGMLTPVSQRFVAGRQRHVRVACAQRKSAGLNSGGVFVRRAAKITRRDGTRKSRKRRQRRGQARVVVAPTPPAPTAGDQIWRRRKSKAGIWRRSVAIYENLAAVKGETSAAACFSAALLSHAMAASRQSGGGYKPKARRRRRQLINDAVSQAKIRQHLNLLQRNLAAARSSPK